MAINLLDKNTINKIAAGEVVDRREGRPVGQAGQGLDDAGVPCGAAVGDLDDAPRRAAQLLLDGHGERIGPVVVRPVGELEQLADQRLLPPGQAQLPGRQQRLQRLHPRRLVARVLDPAHREGPRRARRTAGQRVGDEAQHRRRPEPAFDPVKRIGPHRRRDQR